MTAELHRLPSRMPTAQLSAELSAALAMRHAIDVIGQLVRLPREQKIALGPDQIDTLATVLQTMAREIRILKLFGNGSAT